MDTVLLRVLAPHYCASCGQIGSVFCESCKNNITDEPFLFCLSCGQPVYAGALCKQCNVPYSRAWCVGNYEGGLAKVVHMFKFERCESAAQELAVLLDAVVPYFAKGSIMVVAVPTVHAHKRVRGYGHAELLAKKFAQLRGLPYGQPLVRSTNTQQRGSGKRLRLEQAKKAFGCKPITGGIYVLVDDVVTTGATVHYAAEALLEAGADEVWLAAICYHPLKKSGS